MRILIATNVLSGKGLAVDSEVLRGELGRLGHVVEVVDWRTTAAPKPADLLIACEVWERHMLDWTLGRVWRVINPEWETPDKIRLTLAAGERILPVCRTEDARQRCPYQGAALLGFTSPDLGWQTWSEHPSIPKRYSSGNLILHPAGGSIARGTLAVLWAWRAAAGQLPEARLVMSHVPRDTCHEVERELERAPRCEVMGRLSEDAFRALQSQCRIHVLPSEYEGWGHLFWEALSLGATIVGTDGPWWQGRRYVAVPASEDGRRHLAPVLHVDPAKLARAIVGAWERPLDPRWVRADYDAALADFRARLAALLDAETQKGPRPPTSGTRAVFTEPSLGQGDGSAQGSRARCPPPPVSCCHPLG